MTEAPSVVFLFDVDNTLVDNDRVQAHLKEHLAQTYGTATRDRYWDILEELREELGYVDYLGALERYRIEALHRPEVLRMSIWLVDYPFADRLYPGALDAVKHVQQWGTPVILSDGDAVFQPRKVERSGLWRAFDGRVLIYIHKEQELDDVARLYPADHYVMIDDKLRILSAVKKIWGERVTTVFPKQGHYAFDPDDTGRVSARRYRACQDQRSRYLRSACIAQEEIGGDRHFKNAALAGRRGDCDLTTANRPPQRRSRVTAVARFPGQTSRCNLKRPSSSLTTRWHSNCLWAVARTRNVCRTYRGD